MSYADITLDAHLPQTVPCLECGRHPTLTPASVFTMISHYCDGRDSYFHRPTYQGAVDAWNQMQRKVAA